MTQTAKEFWILRAQDLFMERAGMDKNEAFYFAEAIYDGNEDEDPADAVDEEISYWGE